MSVLTVTVSQLNRYIKAVLEEDRKLQGLFVKGEVSNFTRHYKSGHLYFSLKDRDSAVKAVMFRSSAEDLRFDPADGMAVLVQCNVGLYERDGAYQLYVTDMQPDGAGALAVAFEQVKARLAAEGLFDEIHKKPLPAYPRRIGVATSETGAALQDMVNVLSRRYPVATLVFHPAQVQGREAPASLIRALQALDRAGCDVIILGRGGGSAEDLAAFNDEKLARAVFAADTPVVSAVGHETDYTICDFVADLRAPTPSAAAELSTPSAEQLARRLASTGLYLRQSAWRLLELRRERLRQLSDSRVLRDPRAFLLRKQERLDFLSASLYNRKSIFIQAYRERLAHRAALLDSLSPLRVLDRGYCAAFVQREGGRQPAMSAALLAPEDRLSLRFRDGTVSAVVSGTEETAEGRTQ